jgi:hypothetical protein
MILWIENPQESIKKVLEQEKCSAKLQNTRPLYKNQLYFYTLSVNGLKIKQKTNPFAMSKIKYLAITFFKKKCKTCMLKVTQYCWIKSKF